MKFLKPIFIPLLILPLACKNLLGDETQIDGASGGNSEAPIVLSLKIFTAASSAGSEVTTGTLVDNGPLTLFAVSVDADGDFVESVSATWTVTNSLGTLSVTSGSSTTFTPNAGAGAEVITATHPTLGTDSTGDLDVEFTVSNLANLEAWFRADLGVTFNGSNEVTDWSDQSTNGNHATQPGVSTLRPIYVPVSIGGKPALFFDGIDDFLTTTGSIVSGTVARTIFIVATNITNTGTYNAFFELTDTGAGVGSNYGITAEVAVRINGNRVFNEGFAPGETKVLTVTNGAGATAAGIETYLDGVQSTQSSVSPNAINTLANPALIGQAVFASSNCHCDIAEIIVYSDLLPLADRQSVETYLADKYGL